MALYDSIPAVVVSPGLAGDAQDAPAFAACVRMARAALGWSQHDLARKLGMTQRSVHRIEQGHCAPRRVTVLAIESLLRDAGLEMSFHRDGGVTLKVPGPAMSAEAALPREH